MYTLSRTSRAAGQILSLAATLGWACLAHAQTDDSFVNWESPHVHPIDITPDMTTLVAVNTADARLEVFDLVDRMPELRVSIPVGLDPVSVRVLNDNEAWVVNHISDSISIVDLSGGYVTRTLQTDDEPADVVFAQGRAFVTASQVNTLMIFDLEDPDAPPARIALHGEDPRALAVSLDGNTVYAAFFESGNGSTIIRGGRPVNGTPYGNALGADSPLGPYGGDNPPPNDGNAFSPPLNPDNPPPPPVGMIVKKDGAGRWMDDNDRDWSPLVSGALSDVSARVPGWDLPDNDIAVIDARSGTLTGYVSGVMNMVMALDVNPLNGRLTAVGTEAHNEVRFEPNLRSHFVTSRYADVVPTNADSLRLRDLNSHLDDEVETLPLAQRANSVGDPRAIMWGPRGRNAWVVGMGSNNIQLINRNGARRGAAVEVGQGPTGIVMNVSGRTPYVYYVLNRFDATISVMAGRTTLATVPFFDPTPEVIKAGRPLLYDSHAGSGLGQASCASCHVDARADRLAWNLGNPAAEMGQIGNQLFHPMKGPLRTTSLIGIVGAPSLHFRGDKRDLTEFAATYTNLQGLEDEPSEEEMLRLEAFIATIHTPPNPYRNLDNSMPGAIEIPGVDNRVGNPNAPTSNNCVNCHGGPTARDGRYRNNSGNMPGSVFSDSQPAIAPSLLSMYEIFGLDYSSPDGSTAGFGFIPDGSNDLEAGGTLLNNNRVAFMMAFNGDRPNDTHAAVGRQVTLSAATTSDEGLLSSLLTLAQDREIGLVAHGLFRGTTAGFAFDPVANHYESTNGRAWTHGDIVRAASQSGFVTFTAVPYGTQLRIGVDRDNDGVIDRANQRDSLAPEFTSVP